MDVVRATRVGQSRKKMPRKKDRRIFSKTASRVRSENYTMRGGTRL